MRKVALAALVGFGIMAAGVAAAEPWIDPAGRMTLNAPRGWTVRPQAMDGGTALLAFTPSSDCFFFGIPNPASANSTPYAAHRTRTQISNEAWAAAASAVRDFAGSQTLEASVDTSGFWPIQRARLQSGDRAVHGVISIRPGVELRGFCSGGDANYDAILNTLAHPNDATWQAEVEAALAAAATGQAPATPTPAPSN